MKLENDSLSCVLIKISAAILLWFLCTTPIFYVIVFTENVEPDTYMIARALRFVLPAAVSGVICIRNRKVAAYNEPQRKRYMKYILGCICAGLWLHFSNFTPKLYGTISYTIGIYNLETTPRFLAILWEQMFDGDLYWSILLCLGMTCFKWNRRAELHEERAKN